MKVVAWAPGLSYERHASGLPHLVAYASHAVVRYFIARVIWHLPLAIAAVVAVIACVGVIRARRR